MKAEHKELIKELSDLLKENNLHEIEYQENGVLLKVVAQTQAVPVVMPSTPASTQSQPAEKQEKNILTCPMVGVVYLAPSPDAPTYVKVGDTISVGQTICLVDLRAKTRTSLVSHILKQQRHTRKFQMAWR